MTPSQLQQMSAEEFAKRCADVHFGKPERAELLRRLQLAASETARADAAERKRDEFHALLIAAGIDLTQAGQLRNDLETANQHASELNAALDTARQTLQDIQEISSGRVGKPPTYSTLRQIYDTARAALNPPTQEKTTK